MKKRAVVMAVIAVVLAAVITHSLESYGNFKTERG